MEHDKQQRSTNQRTSRENVPSHGGNSPPQITSYSEGCQAFKSVLESRDVDPVSIWQTLLPSLENLIDGRAESLSFDHSRQQFETQVTSRSGVMRP